MSVSLLVARLLLAAVFVVAGVAKLADLPGSRKAVSDFGVPELLARPLGTCLPLVELAAGLALLPSGTARYAASATLVLLLAFVVGIVVALARGQRPDCHCFGQLHSAPAGVGTLVRDLVLILVAGFVLAAGWSNSGTSATAWIGSLDGTQAAGLGLGSALTVGLAFLGWFSVQLLRQNGRLLVRIELLERHLGAPQAATALAPPPRSGPVQAGLAVGSPAPDFSLPDIDGRSQGLDSILAPGRPAVLVFSDPGCGPCGALLPEIAVWQREHRSELTVTVISRGGEPENRRKVQAHGLGQLLLQQDREVSAAYQAHGTPSAVLVDPQKRIASTLAQGADAIRALVQDALRRAPAAPVPPPKEIGIGQPAPPLVLPDLDGRMVALSQLSGQRLLLLFWNPGCGFCQRMLADLKDLDADPPEGAPKLVLISSGTVEQNRALGLRSPVLLDAGFSAGNALGAHGTPMAVLLDAAGNVASPVAAGAEAVLTLAGARERPLAVARWEPQETEDTGVM